MRPHLPFLPENRELSPDDELSELGLNSMQAIEVLFAVEDAYGVSISDDKLDDSTFRTAGSLWETVDAARKTAGDAS